MIKIAKKYSVLATKETSNYQDDPNETLWVTDVLISDLSGIITEYLVLDKPIIYIDPIKKSKAWTGSDMPKVLELAILQNHLSKLNKPLRTQFYFLIDLKEIF